MLHEKGKRKSSAVSGSRSDKLSSEVVKNQHDASLLTVQETCPHKVSLSLRFLGLLFTTTILLSLMMGRAARTMFVESRNRDFSTPQEPVSAVINRSGILEPQGLTTQLPNPTAIDGKRIPHTVYTSKVIETPRSLSSDSVHVRRPLENDQWEDCVGTNGTDQQCFVNPPHNEATGNHEEHLPAGQHVLADIRNVDNIFLNSKERLAHAMVEVVRHAGLTMLSYHCHSLHPTGISCVAVLLESHISFHSWPDHGVILLDLFTCGSSSLLPLIPVIKNLFGVPRPPVDGESTDPPFMLWAHKLRGFRPDDEADALSNDLGVYYLGVLELEMKEKIASVETKFQTIDIYDFIEPRFSSLEAYQRSLSNDGSYESTHPDLHQPNRILFLDGVMQSQRKGEAEYHEALVHPAMFAHANPKRVAIIGGGEGATLREVLKHSTVEEVVMIEIDEQMVNLSRAFLPEWNDCSDLAGSERNCFDDPRATVYHEDALQWFITRYLDYDLIKSNVSRFDVIIMDALDPEDDIDFSVVLYNNTSFFRSLYNALTSDGILVSQTGEAPSLMDPAESLSKNQKRAMASRHIANQGFESIHSYEESHAGFLGIWTYLVAFKSYQTRKTWFAPEAEVELAMHRRSIRTLSGRLPFRYFDGATMKSYQLPSKAAEAVFCREEPQPPGCERGHGFDPERPLVPVSSFMVTSSLIGKGAGRGVVAKHRIPKGAYIALDDAVNKVYFPPSTFALIDELVNSDDEAFDALEALDYYMHGYGFQGEFYGDFDVAVDAGIITFENHGCNGTYNIGMVSMETELTVDLDKMPDEFSGKLYHDDDGKHYHGDLAYNPFADRNVAHYLHEGSTALRDILPGEEILENYLFFTTNANDWEDDVMRLREMCAGKNVGEVAEYEGLSYET